MAADAARRLRLSPDNSTLRDLLTEISWAKVSNIVPADYAELAASRRPGGGRPRPRRRWDGCSAATSR